MICRNYRYDMVNICSNGDSGGPLMKYGNYPNSQTAYYMLVGIVSFGPKNCGTKDIPGNLIFDLLNNF